MPKINDIDLPKGHKMYIYTKDHDPAHVHIKDKTGDYHAKIEIVSLVLVEAEKYAQSDIDLFREIIFLYRDILLTKWEEIHGQQKK